MGCGASCCVGVPEPEFNPDGSPKDTQNQMQAENDPIELRRYTRDGDLFMIDRLLKRMPLRQINSGAPADEGSPLEKGWSALHYAAQTNQLCVLKKLMLYGAHPGCESAMGFTPLHFALEEGRWKVTEFLISRGAPVNKPSRKGITPLMSAMAAGRKEFVVKFMEQVGGLSKLEINVRDSQGNSAILYAAKWGWFDLMASMLGALKVMPEKGQQVLHSYGMCKGIAILASATVINTRNVDGETPAGWVLKYASSGVVEEEETLALLKAMKEKGLSVTLPAFKERVPLLALAASTGMRSVYDFIIECMPEPEKQVQAKDSLGRTSLHYAAAKNHLDIALDLMSRGLAIHLLDAQKNTPLHLASERGKEGAAKLLLDKAPDKVVALGTANKYGFTVYHLALMAGASEEAQNLSLAYIEVLGDGPATAPVMLDKKKVKTTPLILAIKGHQDKVVQALLEKGAEVNTATFKGDNALAANLSSATDETAAADGAIFKELVARGVDLAPGKGVEHPLVAVSKAPMPALAKEVVAVLREKGPIDWAQEDEQGRTPLHHAALSNNTYIVTQMLDGEAKADVNQKDKLGKTPLMYAAEGCATQCMKLLLNRGANPRVGDAQGRSVMSYTMSLDKASSLSCAAMLLYAGAATEDCSDCTGEGLLHRAVRYGQARFIKLWSRYGGNMAYVATTLPDADDVPGAEEVAAIKIDVMDEEFDPYEVVLDEEEEEDEITTDEKLWQIKDEMEVKRAEWIELINKGELKPPEKDDKKNEHVQPLPTNKDGKAALPKDFKFTAEQWNFFKKQLAKKEKQAAREAAGGAAGASSSSSDSDSDSESKKDKKKKKKGSKDGSDDEEGIKAFGGAIADKIAEGGMAIADAANALVTAFSPTQEVSTVDCSDPTDKDPDMPDMIAGRTKRDLREFLEANQDTAVIMAKNLEDPDVKSRATPAAEASWQMGTIAARVLGQQEGPWEKAQKKRAEAGGSRNNSAKSSATVSSVAKSGAGSDEEDEDGAGPVAEGVEDPAGMGAAAAVEDLSYEPTDGQLRLWRRMGDRWWDVWWGDVRLAPPQDWQEWDKERAKELGIWKKAKHAEAKAKTAEAGNGAPRRGSADGDHAATDGSDVDGDEDDSSDSDDDSSDGDGFDEVDREELLCAALRQARKLTTGLTDAAAAGQGPEQLLGSCLGPDGEPMEISKEHLDLLAERILRGEGIKPEKDANGAVPVGTALAAVRTIRTGSGRFGSAGPSPSASGASTPTHSRAASAIGRLFSLKSAGVLESGGAAGGSGASTPTRGTPATKPSTPVKGGAPMTPSALQKSMLSAVSLAGVGPGPVAEGVCTDTDWTVPKPTDQALDSLAQQLKPSAETVIKKCAKLYDDTVNRGIAMSMQIQDPAIWREQLPNPYGKWNRAKDEFDPDSGLVDKLIERYKEVFEVAIEVNRMSVDFSRKALSSMQKGGAPALFKLLIDEAKEAGEEYGLEPYKEREDFNGQKWRQIQKNGALVPDQFFKQGADGKMYHGLPKYFTQDLGALPDEQRVQALLQEVADRVANPKRAEPDEGEQHGAELRARNIECWIDTFSPEEFPLKEGWWKRVLKKKEKAVAGARARKPLGAKQKAQIRKRVAWFGLPDLPTRPELLHTSALVYAVRLVRPDCVRAMLHSRGLVALNLEDGFGHTPVEYAYLQHFNDRLDIAKGNIVDELLLAGAQIARATPADGNLISTAWPEYAALAQTMLVKAAKVAGSKVPPTPEQVSKLCLSLLGRFCGMERHTVMNPLIGATVSGDMPRLCWMVRKLAAPLNATWVYLPDVPTFFKGFWGNTGGKTQALVLPLHMAVLTEKIELVKLLIKLGSDVNRITMHYNFDGFFTARRYNLFKLREDMLKDLQISQTKIVKQRRAVEAALAKGKPPPPPLAGKKAAKTPAQVLQTFRSKMAAMCFELFNLRDKVAAGNLAKCEKDLAYKGKPRLSKYDLDFDRMFNEAGDPEMPEESAADDTLRSAMGAFSTAVSVMTALKNLLCSPLDDAIAPLKTEKLHCYLSPLHMCGRYGYEEPMLVLLENGAIITGGSAAADTTPLEEALIFARNKMVDRPRNQQPRVLWNAVKHLLGCVSAPCPKAAGEYAESKWLTIFPLVLTTLGPLKFLTARNKEKHLNFKSLGSVQHFDKLRHPVAHWEPSMKAAHVLLLKRAPLNPADGQTNCFLRDLMDNASWEYLKLDKKIDDYAWLEKATGDIMAMTVSNDTGVLAQFGKQRVADFRKALTYYRSRCELAYFEQGFNALQEAYRVDASVLQAQFKAATDNITRNLANFKQGLKDCQDVLEARAAKIQQALAAEAASEAELLATGFSFNEEEDEFAEGWVDNRQRSGGWTSEGGAASAKSTGAKSARCKSAGRVSRSAAKMMKPQPRFELPLRGEPSAAGKAAMAQFLQDQAGAVKDVAGNMTGEVLALQALTATMLVAGSTPFAEAAPTPVTGAAGAASSVTTRVSPMADSVSALAASFSSTDEAGLAVLGLLKKANTTPAVDMEEAAKQIKMQLKLYESDANWEKLAGWYEYYHGIITDDESCLTMKW